MRSTSIAAAVLVLVAAAAGAPPTRPSSKPVWGEAKAGIETSIRVAGEPAPGKLILHLSVHNTGSAPAPLAGAFGWILIAQSKDLAWYTDKLALVPDQTPGWPAKLAADQMVELDLDFTYSNAQPQRKGLKVIDGYPMPPAEEKDAVPCAAAVGKIVVPGSLRVRFMLYLPGPLDAPAGFRSPLVTSNALEVVVPAPEFTTLSPEARAAALAALAKKFRKDEYAAMDAHHAAVKIGPDAVPLLIEQVSDPKAPDFARMWLTTALIDIGDDRALDTLLKLLQTGPPSVRYVIAYHGPKMKIGALDKEILAQAQTGKDPQFATWAARGRAAFAGGTAGPKPPTRPLPTSGD